MGQGDEPCLPEQETVMAVIPHDVGLRQELLGRIRKHQASINTYVRKMQGRRELIANISIVSSAIAAALMVGPSVGREKFTETVQNGLGLATDSSVWGALCWTALIVNIVAAISASLGKSNDPTERIVTADACNAALEELAADVEFNKQSVKLAAAEYGKIAAKILFVTADPADDDDGYSNNGATTPQPSRIIDRYRRRAEVVMPGIAIVFGCVILAATLIGFVLGNGVAAAATPNNTESQRNTGTQVRTVSSLVLSPSRVKIRARYSAMAVGFSPGEEVQFSWVGPTRGWMDDAPRADSGGNTIKGPITEFDPPGDYVLTATGKTSGHTATARLQVIQPDN